MSERIDYEDFKKYDAMFIQLAISLANDYSSIYFMDLATDNYVEYGTRDVGTELEILSACSDFFADVIIRCKEVVYKDDQELFLRRFRKDALLKAHESDFVKEVLGEEFTDLSITDKLSEWDEYLDKVSDWELEKYLLMV